MKTCSKCGEEKPLEEGFHKQSSAFDGRQSRCKACYVVHNEKYREANKEKTVVYQKEYSKEYRASNKKRLAVQKREYCEANLEKERARASKWAKDNPGKRNAQRAKRKATKLNATMPGRDVELREIYVSCPTGYHVDHEIPLQNELVCGLHVPENLQHLTAEENMKKGNKFNPEDHCWVKD